MRTSTSPGPGSGSATGRISPRPGSRSQNARASVGTATLLFPPGSNPNAERRLYRMTVRTAEIRRHGASGRVKCAAGPDRPARRLRLPARAARCPRGRPRPRRVRLGGRCRLRAGLTALLARALTRPARSRLGPADWVTLARAVLVCGVAALTVDSFGRPGARGDPAWRSRRWRSRSTPSTAGWPGVPGPPRRSARASTWRSTRS